MARAKRIGTAPEKRGGLRVFSDVAGTSAVLRIC
jgi:hypothetical protein